MTDSRHALESLRRLVGAEISVSDWITVGQDDINRFAEATGDYQWIHVDRERARRESPWGTTIAHGFYTLSLLPRLMGDFLTEFGIRQGLNYGCEKVRFPAAVPVDSRLRGHFVLQSLDNGPGGAIKATIQGTVEIEGQTKPACVAEQVVLLFPEAANTGDAE